MAWPVARPCNGSCPPTGAEHMEPNEVFPQMGGIGAMAGSAPR
jgi:hypothetical protein